MTIKQIADESFECVWPFCEIGAKRVNKKRKFSNKWELTDKLF